MCSSADSKKNISWNPWILMQLIVSWSLTPSDLNNIERRNSKPDSIKVDVLGSILSTSNAILKPKLSSLSWALWVAWSLFCCFGSLRWLVIIKVGSKNLTVTNCVIYFRKTIIHPLVSILQYEIKLSLRNCLIS